MLVRSPGYAFIGQYAVAESIKLKRAYAAPAPEDSVRILIDRLWPRGVSRKTAKIDQWCKEVAPDTELRRWFGHDPARWTEFVQRYANELSGRKEQLDALRTLARKHRVTLVYAAHDEMHNHAIVLRNVLLGKSPTAVNKNQLKGGKHAKDLN